jgi:CelD/BcsL family acetyltransferase involved in cellulose biosynthesis
MGQLGVDRLGLMISSLVASLREGDADVVRFSHLPVESEVWRLLGSLPSRLTRDNSRVESVHWKAILGRSYEDFLKSRGRNTRRNLKRYSRAFEEKYHERARVRCLADEREVELVMRDTELVAQKTYQRGLGAGFVANEETRQSMLLASRKGWLRAYVLYLDERPIAFLYGNKYGRTFYAGTTGFDPAHEADNVGTYLLARVIQDLYHENISEIDFGFGDAQYKQDLCDCSWTEAVRFVYAPTVRGLWIRTLRTVESLGVRLGRRLVGSGTVYLRLKTAWRKLAKP